MSGVELVAGKNVTKIAKKPPKRQTEQAKAGSKYVQMSARDRGVKLPQPEKAAPAPMSLPPCLMDNTSEAGKERARKLGRL